MLYGKFKFNIIISIVYTMIKHNQLFVIVPLVVFMTYCSSAASVLADRSIASDLAHANS